MSTEPKSHNGKRKVTTKRLLQMKEKGEPIAALTAYDFLMAQLLDAAPRLLPALAGAGFRFAWAGLRPATPDGLPLVGPVPGSPGLVLASGHFRNGVLLSPITAELVVDFLLGKGIPEDAEAFRPERLLHGSG